MIVSIALFNKIFVKDQVLALQISRIFTPNNCYAIFRLSRLAVPLLPKPEIQKITLIDPLSEKESIFKTEITNLAYLFHKQGTVVQVIYSGRQDKDYGTCGDISLIMLQELIENTINQKVIDDHLIASSLYNFESSMLHNFDYDNTQLEVAGGVPFVFSDYTINQASYIGGFISFKHTIFIILN